MTDHPLDAIPEGFPVPHGPSAEAAVRSAQAVALKTSGLSYRAIADRLGYGAWEDVRRAIWTTIDEYTAEKVHEMRQVENVRYDRAQAALWPAVLAGQPRAVDSFVRLSARRCRLNGLDAPQQIAVSSNLRSDLSDALLTLREVVLGEVTDSHVDPYPADPA